ncbi:hypothetical protein MMC25_005758 [Agyrium rufum]|nr:hypothetical protein [Agyrium rufum]
MVLNDLGFRARATSLIHGNSPFRYHDPSPERPLPESQPIAPSSASPTEQNEKRSPSASSADKTLIASAADPVEEDREKNRLVRTIPTWVRTLNEDDEEDLISPTSHLLPHPPPSATIAQHNHAPSPKTKDSHTPGRLHDADREWTPAIPRDHFSVSGSQWRTFAEASAYPSFKMTPPDQSQNSASEEPSEIRSPDWIAEHGADYSQPWLGGAHATDSNGDLEKNGVKRLIRNRSARLVFYKRVQRVILRNAIVPLVIRLIVWIFSLVAMTLGALIYHKRASDAVERKTSPEMAVIVDAVALVYLIYITYDEYTGKPLGLRPAKSKMRLIFLDLFFIVFDSANLSLAYEALGEVADTCGAAGRSDVCGEQKALAWVLLIALVAWLLTFSISVFR